MSKENITKSEVAGWIRDLMPYIKNPPILSPKGCFKGDVIFRPGKVIEYDAALLTVPPKFIESHDVLKSLIQLYCNAEDCYNNDNNTIKNGSTNE